MLEAYKIDKEPPSTGAFKKALAPVAHWDHEGSALSLHPDTSDLFVLTALLEDELNTRTHTVTDEPSTHARDAKHAARATRP